MIQVQVWNDNDKLRQDQTSINVADKDAFHAASKDSTNGASSTKASVFSSFFCTHIPYHISQGTPPRPPFNCYTFGTSQPRRHGPWIVTWQQHKPARLPWSVACEGVVAHVAWLSHLQWGTRTDAGAHFVTQSSCFMIWCYGSKYQWILNDWGRHGRYFAKQLKLDEVYVTIDFPTR